MRPQEPSERQHLHCNGSGDATPGSPASIVVNGRDATDRRDPNHDELPTTMLPVVGAEDGAKHAQIELAKSVPYAPTSQFDSTTNTEAILIDTEATLIDSWAVVLHTYAVSTVVSFVVIGTSRLSNGSNANPSMQLVVSHWSPGSSLRKGPQLERHLFVPTKHSSNVNTAINFTADTEHINLFSYVLQWSRESNMQLRLYTKQPCVPHKFASAFWKTFLEVHDNTKDSKLSSPLEFSISRTDQRTIRGFIPDPILNEPICLHDLIQESVRAVPSASAVDAWDGSFTYRELDQLTDKVAHQLVEKGVRRGHCVPFSFEKSKWMVVAVLGILKAGGAIVPIDPSQPLARVKTIIAETSCKIIVASPAQASRFIDQVENLLLVSPQSLGAIHAELDTDTTGLPRVGIRDPAMIIFTSGSTGKPKGILIEHGAASTRMVAEGRSLGYQRARVLQFAASTWDVFVCDIFTTLIFRGCVCVPSEEDRRFNLPKFCTAHNVSLAVFTPSLATLLDPSDFPNLKTIIFAGEALREDVVQKWRRITSISLLQGYGPAETGPCISAAVVNDQPEVIGYSMDHSVCMLVDPNDHGRLVPIGSIGELVVGGPGVLREYLKNPSKTHASIISNPAWSIELDLPVRQFYKTGDLLRYSINTLDGRFEFVGRADDQIKYHGQRIEVKEIEYHINQLPDISSSMVTLVKDGYFKGRLLAIVETNNRQDSRSYSGELSVRHNTSLTLSCLRAALSSQLPDYMVPNELLVVVEMPHSSSAKLDRRLIDNWVSNMQNQTSISSQSQDTQSQSSKLNANESTAMIISEQYAQIVNAGLKSCNGAFGELDFNLQQGGIDSIQLMSLATSLREIFGVQVPMSEMLSSRSTVRSIAAMIDTGKSHGHELEDLTSPNLHDEIDHHLQSINTTSKSRLPNDHTSNILLTGASGFLGIEILRQLLTQWDCHVYALVRESTHEGALPYLIRKATAAEWWDNAYLSRLHVWSGDLTKPRLGLSANQWCMLEASSSPGIDAIVHNGAKVHYNLDYESVKATNVSSTVELLKAVRSRKQPLQAFVFVSGGQQLRFDDTDEAELIQESSTASGYSRSKVVSELVVKKFALQEDLKARHIRVIKPGFIIGDSARGAANQVDFLWRLIAACIEIGSYNMDDATGWVTVADVARVAQAVTHGVFKEDCKPTTKIMDGLKFDDLWSLLKHKFGYKMQPLSRKLWLKKLQTAVAAKREKHVMFPLMHMLEEDEGSIGVQKGPSHASPGILAAFEANITNLINAGFLPRTPSRNMFCSDVPNTDKLDMQSVRDQFPGLHEGLVPFNNAGGTCLLKSAVEGTQAHMFSCPVELGRDDPHSREKTKRLMESYEELAAFMNAAPDEIAFGQSTTMLLRTLGQALRPLLNADCEIVVSNLCHEASIAAWKALAQDLNIAIKWWTPPSGDNPSLSLETLRPLLTPKTRIVTCNHVSNVVGTIHPIRQVADMVHSIPGAMLIVDGVAWAPHRPIDVKALEVDFYCFSWYKVFGPHVAQLYGRRSVQQRALTGISHFFLNGMPGLDWRLRLGMNAFELEAALVPITRYLKRLGWDKIIAQETVLQEALLAHLREQPQRYRILGERSSDPTKRVSLITFQVPGRSSTEIVDKICQQGRFRLVSGHCWAPRPTHDVLKMSEDGLIRISFVHYNTFAEVRDFCRDLDSVVVSMKRGK